MEMQPIKKPLRHKKIKWGSLILSAVLFSHASIGKAAELAACPNAAELQANVSKLSNEIALLRNLQLLEMQRGSEYNRAHNPDVYVIGGILATEAALVAGFHYIPGVSQNMKDAAILYGLFVGGIAGVVGGEVIADKIAPEYDKTELLALMKRDETLTRQHDALAVQLKKAREGGCSSEQAASVNGGQVSKSGGLLAVGPTVGSEGESASEGR